MNVSTQIIEVIEALCEKFGIAIDWSAQNIMPYIQTLIERYANYIVGTRIFGISFGLVVFLVYFIFYIAWYNHAKKQDNGIDWNYEITVPLVIIIVGNLVVAPILANQIFEAMYIPEASFIKYIQGHINN